MEKSFDIRARHIRKKLDDIDDLMNQKYSTKWREGLRLATLAMREIIVEISLLQNNKPKE